MDERTYKLFKKLDKRIEENFKALTEAKKNEDKIFALVSLKIKKIQKELKNLQNIKLDYHFYKDLHKKLFEDIYPKIAGKLRDIDIIKREPLLDGRSIKYGTTEELRKTGHISLDNFEKNLQNEKDFNKRKEILLENSVKIWKLHYFFEGNTRTTALYTDIVAKKYGLETNLCNEDISKLRDAYVIAVDKNDYNKLKKLYNIKEKIIENYNCLTGNRINVVSHSSSEDKWIAKSDVEKYNISVKEGAKSIQSEVGHIEGDKLSKTFITYYNISDLKITKEIEQKFVPMKEKVKGKEKDRGIER